MLIFNSHETQFVRLEELELSNQRAVLLPLGAAAYSAGRLRAAAHTSPQPTTDLVLLSGSLLHLDLCINVLLCLPPLSLSRSLSHALSFPFSPPPLSRWSRTLHVDESDHSDGSGASVFVVCCHRSATAVSDFDTAAPHNYIVGHPSRLRIYIHVHPQAG